MNVTFDLTSEECNILIDALFQYGDERLQSARDLKILGSHFPYAKTMQLSESEKRKGNVAFNLKAQIEEIYGKKA